MQLFGNINEEFTGEIFEHISAEEIYQRFLYYTPDIKSFYKSPFKEEKTPSFRFFVHNGSLFFKCFATGHSGNAVNLVALLHNCSYKQAIQIIANNCKIEKRIPISSTYLPETKSAKIEVELFDIIPESFYSYWAKYSVTKKELAFFNIKPAKYVWLNDKHILTYKAEQPIIRYIINDKYKIYNPYNKNFKWLSNTKSYDVFALNKIPKQGNLLIITKAMKDILCWSLLKIPAIAMCSESCIASEDLINDLKSRYSKILVFLDNDEAGQKAMKSYYEKYNLSCFMLPLETNHKDISDYIEDHGLNKFKTLLKTLKPINYDNFSSNLIK